jgi:DNA-binding NtrC family response regulator
VAKPKFTTTRVDYGFNQVDAETIELYKEVEAFAKQGQSIIIFGPSGAGKEFLARHYYKTLTNTEYYEQCRENWNSNYNEIAEQYSKHYTKEIANIFLDSISAGTFHAINSATIPPDLAESILFGHEIGSFTGSFTKPGLLESIKYGVVFLDEIGELRKNVQAKLLRAMDSEIATACRIGGKMEYSLKDLIIISATNQPPAMFRVDFLNRLGFAVEIKGIDDRPNDVLRAIPYFICKAIGKRKDYAAIINMFGIRGLHEVNKISETDEVKNFSEKHKSFVADKVFKRKWPGNFRALRRAIEASVFRIESTTSLNSFTREFRLYFDHYVKKNSIDKEKIPIASDVDSFPAYPDLERRIFEKIDGETVFQYMSDFEKKLLASFLSSKHKTGFMRKDLEGKYIKQGTIKHTSVAHIRSKINKLLSVNILTRSGSNKSTRYHLADCLLHAELIKGADIFSLPKVNAAWSRRDAEIMGLEQSLRNTERVYIQSPSRYGKTAFLTMFCDSMKEKYNFYYYPLAEAGIKNFFEDIYGLLGLEIKTTTFEFSGNVVDTVHPFLGKLFVTKNKAKPVLILDNAHYIFYPYDSRTIVDMARKWQEVILILLGDTMDNAFLEDFHEFALEPWNKPS